MIDRSLMFTILTILREQKSLAGGTEETNLFNEVNLRATVAVNTALLREHLQLAEDKGWADWKRDSLRAKRWRITPAGIDALSDLVTGG